MGADLRVISGKFRGRVLKSPKSDTTHPMGAREKLALFNMVNVESAKVLDVYAGSGALGVEALSRGAQSVIFVENSRKIAQVIRENLQALDIAAPEQAQIFIEKVGAFTQRSEFIEYFEVILADPPYDRFNALELQGLGTLLCQGGTLALSSPANLEPVELDGLRISSTHTYAKARITIYRK